MRDAIRRGAEATATLMDGLRTALPALFGVVAMPVLLLALPVLPEAVAPVRALADAERARLGQRLGHDIPRPYRPHEGGRWHRCRATMRDPATWRDLAWLLVHGVCGPFLGLTAIVLWPGILASLTTPLYWRLLPPGTISGMLVEVRTWPQALTLPFAEAVTYAAAVCWLVPLAVRGQMWLAESLLRPAGRTEQAQRIERLTRSRTEALESHGAELRRIERDLHDGVQTQLVSVAVRLGLIERALSAESTTALSLLQDARTNIEDSMTNLRGVIRGIYPPILADRGLTGAVHALAGGQRVPVAVRIPNNLPQLAAPVETAAYFVIAESLTNVAKHSTADHAEVTVEYDRTQVRVVVRDNGQGGVEQADGTGLTGIQRRVAALDGGARITSPVNEGTTVEVLLPCE